MLKIKHNSGFFSCCSVRLHDIVAYINSNKQLPDIVDSSHQFTWYKNYTNMHKDITFDYFEQDVNITDIDILSPIHYTHNNQFTPYRYLDYKSLSPLIKKYFTPSMEINTIIHTIETKYNLMYDNICVLFYRGNDKITETKKCGYNEYLHFANDLLKKNPKVVFLIQSDETEFIEFMTNNFPNNSVYFKDEIRHMKKCNSTVDHVMKNTAYDFSKKYLAITIVMSRCKYIICGSGNCDIWIMLYRGNTTNVIQNLNGGWYEKYRGLM